MFSNNEKRKYLLGFILLLAAGIFLFLYSFHTDSSDFPAAVTKSGWYDRKTGQFRCPVKEDSRKWKRLSVQEKIEVQTIPEEMIPWIPPDNLVDLYWELDYFACSVSEDGTLIWNQAEANKIFEGRLDAAEYLLQRYEEEWVTPHDVVKKIEYLLERQVLQQTMTDEMREQFNQLRSEKDKLRRGMGYYTNTSDRDRYIRKR
ncbi:hypothetical protein [Anaerolentibacter hominis]|uniref:hypothetical protein n=1 Tax=Anaerolentibacter hominis TaxID=3079009 RepID=UPI0031B85517